MVGYTLLLFLQLLCALPYVNVQLKYINAPDAILLIFIFFSFITFGNHQVCKYGNMILTFYFYQNRYMIILNGFLRIPRNNHNKDQQY